jgi:hypothetical protein
VKSCALVQCGLTSWKSEAYAEEFFFSSKYVNENIITISVDKFI